MKGGPPGLHNKIPALKIFARGWVAQESMFYTINAKIFQGLGPKRRESSNGKCSCDNNNVIFGIIIIMGFEERKRGS